ncbi:MAG: hypothetical protein OXH36_03050 [Bdellovibrionales bacterium]|nr:hypothetical protein [Bdellovibrionales bacterium]
MRILKCLIYIAASCVLGLYLSACHLDNDKPPPGPTPPPPDPVEPTQSLVWSGSLEFTNPKRYRHLLRDQRKCDPCTAYFGPLNCKNFDSRADVEMKFEKQELPSKVTVKIKPYYSGNGLPFYGYLGACGFTVSPETPFELKGTAKYWNEYKGFHVQLKETKGFGALSYLIVRSRYSNHVENGMLDVVMYYGGSASQGFEFGKADLENPDLDDGYTHQPSGR